jgi:hypothetical protein
LDACRGRVILPRRVKTAIDEKKAQFSLDASAGIVVLATPEIERRS